MIRRKAEFERAKKGCFGKLQHKSMLAAEYVFNRMNGKKSHLLEIYKCRFCNYFHIGHNNLKDEVSKNKILEKAQGE